MRKLIILFSLPIFIFTGCSSNTNYLPDDATPEEILAYENSITSEYEVISATQYLETKTDRFGMIRSQKLKFSFTYIDELGELKTYDGFENTEYGLTSVCLGKENKYVVKDFGANVYKTLYLTEDCLANVY